MNHDDSLSQEKLPQLPAPHFNEETIAHAQPVEPLSDTDRQNSWVRGPALSSAVTIVLLIAVVITLALVLINLRPSAGLGPEAVVTPIETSIQNETADTSSASVETESTQKPKPRKIKLYVPYSQSRPVARRVGVIYGR